jgi:hypothetical protein
MHFSLIDNDRLVESVFRHNLCAENAQSSSFIWWNKLENYKSAPCIGASFGYVCTIVPR